MLVDSHCHLDYLEREGLDLDEVVGRARRAGVGRMVTICTKLSGAGQVIAIAERYPDVYATVGVHPHEADAEGQGDPERLIALAQHPKVVGIGETGLDFYYDNSDRQAQARSFRAHIAAARALGLPLIVHARDADDETVAILKEEAGKGAFPGLIHCFTAGPELARVACEIGFYVSIAGIVTFKTADALRAVVADIPVDRLLVETDSPFLAPVPHRGRKNEPAYVVHTAERLAEVKAMPTSELIAATGDNFFRLFGKVERSAA